MREINKIVVDYLGTISRCADMNKCCTCSVYSSLNNRERSQVERPECQNTITIVWISALRSFKPKANRAPAAPSLREQVSGKKADQLPQQKPEDKPKRAESGGDRCGTRIARHDL